MEKYLTFVKKIRHSYYFIVLLFALIITLIGYSYFSQTEAFAHLQIWANANNFRFSLLLILIKIVGIIWPPLPGIVFLIGAIPILGWFHVFLLDGVGYLVGSSIAFYLSKRYGIKTIRFFFGQSGVNQVKKFNINPDRELEAITLMKIFGGGVNEFISYAAGLTKMKFRNFMLGNIISLLVVGLPLFYFFDFAFSSGNLIFGLLPIILGAGLFYLLRNRYFFWGDPDELIDSKLIDSK